MRVTRSAMSLGGLFARMGLCVAAVQSIGGGLARADSKSEKPDSVAVGYEIFNREWLPNDPRSHGGDGLGPVYNDSSCVACHNSGGSGGAGPVSKNIDILNASRNRGNVIQPPTGGRQAVVTADVDQPPDRFPRRFPDQPNGRPAQVRHRPELRCLAQPGPQFGSNARSSKAVPQSPDRFAPAGS